MIFLIFPLFVWLTCIAFAVNPLLGIATGFVLFFGVRV